jgi:outer membrane lipoprotein carrier protein
MIRKLSVFVIMMTFLLTANCAFCGANGEDLGGGSDEMLVMKKDTPAAVTAPAGITETAAPAAATLTAIPAITTTAKPAAAVKTLKKSTPAVKKSKSSAVKNTPAEVSPEQKKINSLVLQVKEKQSGRKAMMSDIVIKTSYVGAGAAGQEVKGRVYIKKKDKFKVHYTEPTEQFLISNGKWMWVYTPNLKQVIKQAAADAALDTNFYIEIENSIEYFVNNSRTKMEETDSVYTLVMIPKDRKKLDFDEITVKIEKAGLVPGYMSMKYDGSLSEVTFFNVKNYTAEEAAAVDGLLDTNFEFKTPDGVEEIEASALIDAATE